MNSSGFDNSSLQFSKIQPEKLLIISSIDKAHHQWQK